MNPGDVELEHARALMRSGRPPETIDWSREGGADAVATGWALKFACYETWNTAPALAGRAAALLAGLRDAHTIPVLGALAAWTEGISLLGAGRMESALTSLDAAAAGFESLGDTAHAAQTQVPKLMALSVLGRHDDALQCAEATLARFLATGDERSAGKIELNLGTMLFRQDRHAEAAARYRSSAARFAQVQDIEQSITADIGLANALSWQGEFEEALRINARAGDLAVDQGYSVLAAQAHGSIGQLELLRGRPERALPELLTACRLFEQAGGLPQRMVEAEIALADAYLAVNLLPEAAALAERVIARAAELDLPAEQARAHLQRAQARAALGDVASARDDLTTARGLFAAQDNPASAALASLGAAALDLRQGQFDLALAAAEAAAQVFTSVGIPGWQAEAELIAAGACVAAGAAAEARARFEVLSQASGANAAIVWRAELGLADLDTAEGERARAAQRLDAVLATLEARRAALPGDEARTAFGVDSASVHDRRIALAWAAFELGQPGTEDTLWRSIESARAGALALGLAVPRRVAIADGIAASHPERDRLAWLRDQAAQALAQGDAGSAAELATQARAQEQRLLEAHRRAELQRPVAEVAAAQPPTLADVQATLTAGEAWVQYHLLADRWLAVVLTRDSRHWHEGAVDGLSDRLESLRFQLDAVRGRPPGLQAHGALLAERTRRHLQALHERLWAPLEASLAGCSRVRIAPHRLLHYLPWAALHDGQGWLVDRFEISLVPSARIGLGTTASAAPRFDRVLALGIGGSSLPHVTTEARAVAEAFGAGATLLLDAEATGAALRREAPLADLLHLACHAQFRADSPYFSALHLADGELTLRDAAALPLRAALVTLSACETGLSRVAPGDELVGLVRGFLLAGARHVMASLWTVDDASTAELMRAVYAGLIRGQRPAQALQAAQAALARAGHHPFYWAAFSLHARGC